MNIERAIQIACLAHNGQKDKCGEPYILHPLYVMNNLEDNNESTRLVAILHDVFEYSNFKLDHFKKELSEQEYEALKLLTRENGKSYAEYIYGIQYNAIAITVKLADLSHNMLKHRYYGAIRNGSNEEYMKYKDRVYHAAFEILFELRYENEKEKDVIIDLIDSIEKPKKKK